MTQAWDFVDASILWQEKQISPRHLQVGEDVGFSMRTLNVLQHYRKPVGAEWREAPIVTLGDLADHTEAEMLGQPNCGRKSVQEMKNALAHYGLEFYRIRGT